MLETIGPVPGKELIKQWLKAGYVEHGTFHATEQGTPQGGVVSPLLANIALHGMEEAIGVTYDSRGQLIGKRAVVRYADDVRHLTQDEILLSEKRGSEGETSGSSHQPGRES